MPELNERLEISFFQCQSANDLARMRAFTGSAEHSLLFRASTGTLWFTIIIVLNAKCLYAFVLGKLF